MSDQTFPCHDRENVWRPARLDSRYPGVLGNQVRTCSYCGSMHPDDLMVGVRDGTFVVGPTDKNYKAYVGLAPTEAELVKKRAELEAQAPIQYPDESFCDEHSSEDREQARARWVERSLMMMGGTIGKFYYEGHSKPVEPPSTAASDFPWDMELKSRRMMTH